jgi:hypothetical protein
MSSQIFKNKIPNELLFSLLENICLKTDKYYIFNNDSFKKGIYKGLFDDFIETCRPYYFTSKYKYLNKNITVKSFVTIMRQICKSNSIVYTSQIKYEKSSYDIFYYVYF